MVPSFFSGKTTPGLKPRSGDVTHFELYAYDQTTAYSNDAVEVSVDPLPAHA